MSLAEKINTHDSTSKDSGSSGEEEYEAIKRWIQELIKRRGNGIIERADLITLLSHISQFNFYQLKTVETITHRLDILPYIKLEVKKSKNSRLHKSETKQVRAYDTGQISAMAGIVYFLTQQMEPGGSHQALLTINSKPQLWAGAVVQAAESTDKMFGRNNVSSSIDIGVTMVIKGQAQKDPQFFRKFFKGGSKK